MTDADPSLHEQATEAFAAAAQDEFGDQIEDLIVFGSTVRGETRGMDSDVDIFMIVTNESIVDDLRDLAYDVQLDYSVVVSVHVQTAERFAERKNHPFIKHVLSEGRSYA
ncbi:nucleotidyltransferase domain-containing protein [Haladaptatus pallidirubidus]|uniref:Polymerase nucleotidyl transferase domain-containing protein n=1 Tax=Haladaptatus pallidirubidus TaxID=1008152 RepID=A0AAV3UQ63_9EURY|nr:nucleotidyltransferase domain-containing protein [Haladaptatus pallidirubidus]